ncbi:hypothetical protein GLE_3644 [Lysobacter enzymogenes]|uniref:Uncharacterized protein n=1 Tax=Lysobacter enzymogenes TaxID=69 RepID=A0A0S2DKB4_LYSEN|nr:DUF2268 domain-containing putative Zn-dependent protease [Lysobacter enzymogenes]ALN58988.1 hypothetical protein GLE_3644 [Lysobacter enzymogenes]
MNLRLRVVSVAASASASVSALARSVAVALLLAGAASAASADAGPAPAREPVVDIADVERFYAVYDAARGKPDAQALQRGYLDSGTPALRQFAAARIGTMQRLAERIGERPQAYEKARACAQRLPQIRAGVRAAMAELGRIYPEASFPPVTLAIGRGGTGGTTTPAGVVIGVETICSADWLQPDLTARFVHLIAHEYAHVQQPGAAVETPGASLLYQALIEGGAELVGELSSGEVNAVHLRERTRGRECEFEREFAAEQGGSDLSRWFYNGVGDARRPGDLGYWAGYRIAAAFHARAADKRRALYELLHATPENAQDLLRRSGWRPQCGETAASASRASASAIDPLEGGLKRRA